MENEQDYYARRAEAERRLAGVAASEDARRRHLELAELLAGRAIGLSLPGSAPPRSRRSAAAPGDRKSAT